MAQAAGLDLVEIAPNSTPPVCKILDYGKYKFQAQKKAAEARKKQKVVEVKEIKLRPMIDDHDYDVKMRSMKRFFEEGDKVKITLRFRGREMAHQELGYQLLDRVKDDTGTSPRSNPSRGSKAARWSWCWRRARFRTACPGVQSRLRKIAVARQYFHAGSAPGTGCSCMARRPLP